MRFVPVVNRELNVLARRSASYWARTATAFLAFLVMTWLLAFTAQGSFLGLGRSIFVILSWVAFAYALVAGIHATADCISEEKRDGTLGLLFLTDLRALDVILGKMSAGSVSAAYALLAILPMISLGLLVGGVALRELSEAAAILANTLFFSLALGVFISTLSRNERRSVFAASVTMFLLVVFPFAFIFWGALSGYFVNFRTGLEVIGWLSPIYPMLELHLSTGPGGVILTGQQRYVSLGAYHGLAWVLLIGACGILPRFINDAPGKRTAKIRAAGETLVMGTRRQRQARRRQLLDRNAFLWLVSRERGKGVQAWFLVLFFVGLYLWVALNHSNLAHDLPINITILLTVHYTLKLWLTSDVCNRLIQDRRDGALELLLATPLTVARIAQGQTLALRRVFFGPVLALLICEGLLACLEYKAGRQRPAAADRVLTYATLGGTLLANLWALKWVGLWRSLWGKGIERVLGSTLGIVLGVPLFAFGTVYILARVFANVGGVEAPYRFFIIAFALITSGWAIPAGWSARRKFFTYFRECAANRFGGEGAAPPCPAPPANKPAIPFWRRPAFVGLCFVLAMIVLAGLGRRAFWTLKLRSEISKVRREGFPVGSVWKPEAGGARGPAAELREPVPSQGFEAWNNNRSRYVTRSFDFSELEPALKVNGRELQALRQLTNYNALDLSLTNRVNFARYSALGCIEFLSASAANDQARAFQAVRGLLALIRLLQTSTRPDAQYFVQECLNNLAMVLNGRLRFTPEQLQVLADDLNSIPEDAAMTRLAFARAVIFQEGLVWANLNPGNLAHRIVLSFQLWSGSRAKGQWLGTRSFRHAIEIAAQAQAPERFDALANWPAELRFRPIFSAEEFEEAVRFHARQTIQREAEITAWLRVLKSAVWVAQLRSMGRESENHQESVHFVDPFSGDRIKTRRNRHGALAIYSVGPDRRDHEANIRVPFNATGDLVILLPPR